MLELRPSCEHCERLLPPEVGGAYICSYECTFCAVCAETLLSMVCPNCTGALVPRPPRPTGQLAAAPAGTNVVHKPADLTAHAPKVAARFAEAGMIAHLWEIVVDCADPARLAEFYGALLGVDPVVRAADWAFVDPASRGAMLRIGGTPPLGVRLAFQKVPEPKQAKVRIHLDFGSYDLDASAANAKALGGTRLTSEQQADVGGAYIVMADPEGHEFCFVEA